MTNFETAQPLAEQRPDYQELFQRYLINEKQKYLHKFETAYEFTSPLYDVDSRENQATQLVEHMGLEELQPNAPERNLGYQEARDAKRWWVFRGLYLRGMVAPSQNIGQSDPNIHPDIYGGQTMQLDPNHRLSVLYREQGHAHAALKLGDPLYTQLFSDLEKMRQYTQDKEQAFFPLATEREFALAMLWGSMERALESRGEVRKKVFCGEVENTKQVRTFSLEKGKADDDQVIENMLLNVYNFNPEAFLQAPVGAVPVPQHQFVVEYSPPTKFEASGREICPNNMQFNFINKVFSTITALAWTSQINTNLLKAK